MYTCSNFGLRRSSRGSVSNFQRGTAHPPILIKIATCSAAVSLHLMQTRRIPIALIGGLCLFLSLSLGNSQPAPAQSLSLSGASSVSVLTMMPGSELYSAWGHTAIRVTDPYAGLDVTFNYGTFDFEQPNFYLKFVRGQLEYELSAASFEQTMRAYRFLERAVIEQRLDLSLEQRRSLFERLQVNYLPENRAYRYDFFFDNCSTRPRDVLEETLHLHIGSDTARPEADSFRQLLKPGLADMSWTEFGIDLVLGLPADRIASPRERLFLPLELLGALDTLHAGVGPDRRPVVSQTDTLYRPEEPAVARSRVPSAPFLIWVAGLGWITVLLVARRRGAVRIVRLLDTVLFLVLGLAGTLMLLLWLATDHSVTSWNLNLLWAWPSHLWVAFRLTGHATKSLLRYWQATAVFCLTVLLLWPIWPQDLPAAAIPVLLVVLARTADRAGLLTRRQRPRKEEK